MSEPAGDVKCLVHKRFPTSGGGVGLVAKVKFRFSVEKITFEYEGDQDTGLAVNRAMNHMLGSMAEAQNRVIDVTPEPPMAALPPAPPAPQRRYAGKVKSAMNGHTVGEVSPANGDPVTPKAPRARRSHGSSFRDQTYHLIREGYFSQQRTAHEIEAELSRRGHHYNPKNIASDLLWFVKKNYLSRDRNDDGKYAYVKGANNDFPAGQGGP